MITGNEPAFATPDSGTEFATTWQGQKGLTIRQHFAAMAMQGLCASGFFTEAKLQKQAEAHGANISEALSIAAVDIADNLIKELNREL